MQPSCKIVKRVPSNASAKRLPARLISPDDLQLKRRRIDGKSTDPTTVELTENMAIITSSLPRLGKKQVTEPRALQLLQGIFEDKSIVHAVACTGTERAIAPERVYLQKKHHSNGQ